MFEGKVANVAYGLKAETALSPLEDKNGFPV